MTIHVLVKPSLQEFRQPLVRNCNPGYRFASNPHSLYAKAFKAIASSEPELMPEHESLLGLRR